MGYEEQVIGACLLDGEAIRFAVDHVESTDFASMVLGNVFDVMVAMRAAGKPIEPASVTAGVAEAGIRGVGFTELFKWMEAVGSSHSVDFYAKLVREASVRRSIARAGQSMIQQSQNEAVPSAQVLSEAMTALTGISDNSPGNGMKTITLGDLLAVEDSYDWVIEGLFERGDRMIITGYEGLGKTTWIRQMAICMAAGINPVTLDHCEPQKVLVIDVENTESQWRNEVRGMAKTAQGYGPVSPMENLHLSCNGRVDITKGSSLGEIHRLVDIHKPSVLFIGPIYKLVPHGISNDDDAAPLITALDSLRDRGLVLVMEGHSPKGSANAARDLSPRGSAALMGWPEFGFGLAPDENGNAIVQRWRGERDRKRVWPKTLEKGGPFPWCAPEINPATRQKLYGRPK
ncbi:replicative DNA helicase [Arthrobacter alpinus]|uniref:Replicative DNA helicase n=1 Tax=Arthrobacter alpinus TaxID=656366 RepID=A0A1H5M263_9MICC|nr:AAA family ATPase [Arthrobacter alpinus]SEE83413.1 replicative DNA helicase [Arthrobacter alpinus]